MNKKTRVMVLYGGCSAEHEISLRSAASVIQHLDSSRFDVVPVAIDKHGQWQLNDASRLSLDAQMALELQETAPNVVLPPYRLNGAAEGQNTILPLQASGIDQTIDVIFPVLHGPMGEDGTVQGLFELVDVPYVGSAVLSSALAMDKDVAKRLIIAAGLPTAPFMAIKISDWQKQSDYYLAQIAERFAYPVFVKPANLGSSVGIHKVKAAGDLEAAIADAFQYDIKILVEKALSVREIELAVLENPQTGAPHLVSVPGEIIPTHEFYSYEAKYLDENGAQLVVPAPLTEQQTQQAQQLALQAFDVLECAGMARVDLFLDNETKQFYFNELNTIPGFTSISMYPKLFEASGIPYSELLSRLIDLAIHRHQRKRMLKRDWK